MYCGDVGRGAGVEFGGDAGADFGECAGCAAGGEALVRGLNSALLGSYPTPALTEKHGFSGCVCQHSRNFRILHHPNERV